MFGLAEDTTTSRFTVRVNYFRVARHATRIRPRPGCRGFDKPQRDALAILCLRLGDHQNTAAEILWRYGYSR
jgi:hypothetical protein